MRAVACTSVPIDILSIDLCLYVCVSFFPDIEFDAFSQLKLQHVFNLLGAQINNIEASSNFIFIMWMASKKSTIVIAIVIWLHNRFHENSFFRCCQNLFEFLRLFLWVLLTIPSELLFYCRNWKLMKTFFVNKLSSLAQFFSYKIVKREWFLFHIE